MKICELNIVEFGGLSNRHYTLSDGLNLFEGENESGKSTIWLFIKFMLYGMPKKGHPERERSLNRITRVASGSMVVSVDGATYRIERSVTETSRTKAVTRHLESGEIVFTGEEPGEALLHVPREVFESSCGIGQSACAELGGDKGIGAIRNMLSSADESVDVNKITKQLESYRVHYRHKIGKGGKLYELESNISALEKSFIESSELLLKASELDRKLDTTRKDIQEKESELKDINERLSNAQKAETIKRFEGCAEKKKRLASLKDDREELCKRALMTDHFPTHSDVASLKMLASGYRNALSATDKLRDKRNELADTFSYDKSLSDVGQNISSLGGADALISEIKSINGKKKLGFMLSIVGGVLTAASVALILIPLLTVVGIVAACIGIAAIAVGIFMLASFSKASKRADICPFIKDGYEEYIRRAALAYEEKRRYDSTLSELTENIRFNEEQAGAAFEDLRLALRMTNPDAVPSVDAALDEANRLDDFLRMYSSACTQIDILSASVDDEEKYLSIYDEAVLREEFDPSLAVMNEQARKQDEEKKKFLEHTLGILKQREMFQRTERINLGQPKEEPSVIADRIEALKARYAVANENFAALQMAIEGISRAMAYLQENVTPAIGKEAGRMMDFVTDGKYRSIGMNKSMEVSLVDGQGLTTTDRMMSGGTKDAAYLALRISVMKSLFGDGLPPLMMDDTLCQLDDDRAERILSLVSKLCSDGLQCLMFSCHKREGVICEEKGIAFNHIKMQ